MYKFWKNILTCIYKLLLSLIIDLVSLWKETKILHLKIKKIGTQLSQNFKHIDYIILNKFLNMFNPLLISYAILLILKF